MWGLLLCCLVALASCQNMRYDLTLNAKKIYEYQYEGKAQFGLGMPNHAESGVKLKCIVRIVGASADTFLLQFSNVVFEEFNGFPDTSNFVEDNQLAEHIAAQLAKPIIFTYTAGNVGEIRAPAEVSDTVLNIVRGILDFFQVTVKTTQKIYDLEEVGIHGKCLSNYAAKENKDTKEMLLTQVVDITNCREKASLYSGLANAVVDKVSKQRGESVFSTVKYTYNIKPTAEAGLLTKAQALEVQYFTPFNLKKASLKMEATKELVLMSVKDKTENITINRATESRGNLIYRLVNAAANIPILMQNLDGPVPKAMELIKRLAQANAYEIDKATSEDTIKLYQLLRVIPLENLEKMWADVEENRDQRNWLLHTIVEVNDARILNFLERLLQQEKLNPLEAVTAVVQSFGHLEASPELLQIAERFLTMNFNNSHVRNVVVLAYGSLVNKQCAYYTPCPEEALRPLLAMTEESQRNNNEDDMILFLKALGNAGHPRSLKTIIKFLPGVAPNPVDLNPRVVSAAVQAMRLIATRDPHRVQDITLSLFLNKELSSEIRMLAFMVLFDAKPSMALVSTVTAHLLDETDLQVVSFAYTYLKSFARTNTPDNHFLSTACSVAVKILAPKFGSLNYHFSRAQRVDWFHDDYLIGTAAEAFSLKRAAQMIPAEMMIKGKLYFIGRVLQLLELGLRPEGIKNLFGAGIPGFKGDFSLSDFLALTDVLTKWETLPNDKPVFTFYTRASGQEWYFADFNKDLLERIIRAFSATAGKDSCLWTMVDHLQKGFSWHGVLPYLVTEARYIQATTLGLPLEISKYYHVLNGLTVNAKAAINPPVTGNLGQLLSSETTLETDGFIGYTKNFWVYYGINTELFQSGVELKASNSLAIPWNFAAKINVREWKFELEFPRSTKEIEVFSFSSSAFAISRNIINPDTAIETPMIPKNESLSQVTYSDKFLKPNKWHSTEKMCTKSTIYGVAFCTEAELRQDYYQEEYPLYYFLGYTHFAFKVAPVQETKAVEKIHLEVNAAPSRNPMNIRQLFDILRMMSKDVNQSSTPPSRVQQDRPTRGTDTSPEPVLNIKVLAMSSTQKPEGYDASMYYTPEASIQSTQLIVSHVGEATNWKMCFDTTLASQDKAKAHIAWGAECQTYALSISIARVSGSNPELKANFNSERVPESLVRCGKRVARYIPGMAFLLGFNQKEEQNVVQEVSASVTAASADSVNVMIKFPELTLCREAFPSPLKPANFLHGNRTINTTGQS